MNKSKDWEEFNEYIKSNNEELIKQIEEIEEKQRIPKGAIAELLYREACKGRKAGETLRKILADTVEEGSNAFDKLATAMVVVCKTAPPNKYGITLEELVDSLAYITNDEPSPEQIKRAYEKTREALDKIINPTDKAKESMEKYGMDIEQLPNSLTVQFRVTNPMIMSYPLDIKEKALEPNVKLKRHGMPMSNWIELEITDKDIIRQIAEDMSNKFRK